MIVLMTGLPGTGKSTLARELALRTGGRVVSKDDVRHAIFLPDEIEYSAQQDDFCLQLMLETVEYLLAQDAKRRIFLDGRTFSRRYQIENVLNAATSLHQPWKILECMCSEDSARKRLESDRQDHVAENRDFQLYLEVKARFETIVQPKTVIDTDQPFSECVELALAVLQNP